MAKTDLTTDTQIKRISKNAVQIGKATSYTITSYKALEISIHKERRRYHRL